MEEPIVGRGLPGGDALASSGLGGSGQAEAAAGAGAGAGRVLEGGGGQEWGVLKLLGLDQVSAHGGGPALGGACYSSLADGRALWNGQPRGDAASDLPSCSSLMASRLAPPFCNILQGCCGQGAAC